MNRENILDVAKHTITTEKVDTYGCLENNFKTIASFWSVYKGVDFSENDVAIMMTLLKIARMKTGKVHLDNYVDAIGYIACGTELIRDEQEKAKNNTRGDN